MKCWSGSLMLAVLVAGPEAGLAQQPDFSSPEKTIETYIEALRSGDRTRVAPCFEPPADDFYIPGPAQIDSYKMEQRLVFGAAEVTELNDVGVTPPARVGDVRLTVLQSARDLEQHFVYRLREFAGQWKIIAHSVVGPQDLR